MEKLKIDYSTLNLKELTKLNEYNTLGRTSKRISNSMGEGCFLDPPGYPSHFIQHVYTQQGNDPERGPTALILGRVIRSNENPDVDIRKLWNKLPIDHPRVQEWIKHCYRHQQHCYRDETSKDRLLIYPVPYYVLKSFNVPYFNNETYKYSKEIRIKAKERIEEINNKILEHAKQVAIPENHIAYQKIVKFYPEATPNLELIKNPPKQIGDWYTIYERKPLPEECPGEARWANNTKHPVNGKWCQVCGWREE